MTDAPERLRSARVFVSPQFHRQVRGLGLDPADQVTVASALMRIAAEEFHPMMRPHIVPDTGVEPYVVQAHVVTRGSGDLLIEAIKLSDAPVLMNRVGVTLEPETP